MSSDQESRSDDHLQQLRHEIGNHLGIIVGHAQLLQMEDLTPDVRVSIDEIAGAATKLQAIIKGVGRRSE